MTVGWQIEKRILEARLLHASMLGLTPTSYSESRPRPKDTVVLSQARTATQQHLFHFELFAIDLEDSTDGFLPDFEPQFPMRGATSSFFAYYGRRLFLKIDSMATEAAGEGAKGGGADDQ